MITKYTVKWQEKSAKYITIRAVIDLNPSTKAALPEANEVVGSKTEATAKSLGTYMTILNY